MILSLWRPPKNTLWEYLTLNCAFCPDLNVSTISMDFLYATARGEHRDWFMCTSTDKIESMVFYTHEWQTLHIHVYLRRFLSSLWLRHCTIRLRYTFIFRPYLLQSEHASGACVSLAKITFSTAGWFSIPPAYSCGSGWIKLAPRRAPRCSHSFCTVDLFIEDIVS